MSKVETKPNTDSKLDKFRKTFDRYVERWAKPREQIDLDERCLSLEGPWPAAEMEMRNSPGNERPCLHEDVVTQFHDQTIGQMEMNPMGPDVQPEGDGANEKTAQEVEDRLRQIEYEQNGQHAYQTAGACAVRSSIGFWELETDWKAPDSWEKYICIRAIQDNKSVLVDPDCKKPDWSDMQGAFKLTKLSEESAKEKHGEDVGSFEGYQTKSSLPEGMIQLATHWCIEKTKKNLLFIDDNTPEGLSLFEEDLPKNMKVKRGRGSDGATLVFDSFSFPIIRQSKRQTSKVKKYLIGNRILEETDWEDEEIPIMVATGRVKFENGERSIESQTRRMRVGQLLYDLCISTIQEECAMVPKNLFMGYEGQFDTNTNWKTITREPTAFGEVRATTDELGNDKPLPIPLLQQRIVQIEALLALKQSILLSLQNAAGIPSTERKDRAAKSGKALEQLSEDAKIGSNHYGGSVRMQQLRMYRIINRMLPKIENTARTVGMRDSKGNYRTKDIQADHWESMGSHQVVIGSAKAFQSLQEKQKDFSEALLSAVKDPTIMLAVLPDLIRMSGLGPHGDDLAKMIEAMQPPQMQQARQQDGQPEISAAMLQTLKAQVQKTISALNAHAQDLEHKVQQMVMEKEAKVTELTLQKQIHDSDNQVKLDIAQINASTKENMEALNVQVAYIKNTTDALLKKFDTDAQMADSAASREHEAQQSEADRAHASQEGDADRANQQLMTGAQLEAQREQAEMTAQNQGE